MVTLCQIGVGAAVGANLRYLIGIWRTQRCGATFPLATLLVNITGSVLLGVLAALAADNRISQPVWLLVGVGFLGSYTTFSAFSLENWLLIMSRHWRLAVLYILASVFAGITGAALARSRV